MRRKRFQNRVAESRISLPATGVYAFIVCLLGGMFGEHMWIQFALLAVSAFLMMELNNSNALIRIYSRMVSCSFIALAVMAYFLFVDIKCGIVQTCFIAFYLFLFSTYQSRASVGRVFYAFAMLGLASIYYVQILYFVPVIWVLMATNIMNGCARIYVASLLGLLVPYWFAAGYYAFTDQLSLFDDHLSVLLSFEPQSAWLDVPLVQIVTIAFVALLAIVGMVNFRINNYRDKIRTRMLFDFFSVMIVFTLIFMVFQPTNMHFLLAILIVSASPLIGHFISLTNSLVTNLVFCLMLVATLALTVCNVWIRF
mgnify:FL=1